MWWLDVLENEMKQTISLKHNTNEVTMFCDASSPPPILASVLVTKSSVQFCVLQCPDWLFSKLETGNDDRIMALEPLAIIIGLGTFKQDCKHSVVRIWTGKTSGK